MKRISSIKNNLIQSRLMGNNLYTSGMFCDDLYNFAKSLKSNRIIVVDPSFMVGYTCDCVSVTSLYTNDGKTSIRSYTDMFRAMGYTVPSGCSSVVCIPGSSYWTSHEKVHSLIHNTLECCIIEGVITRSERECLMNNHLVIY